MNRHYFISDDLDDLDRIEEELEHRGVFRPQIHVLSKDDAGIGTHRHLHNIKQDVVHGTLVGAIIGIFAATLVMTLVYFSDLPDTYPWTSFIFLAVIVFGFITWSSGFYAIQTPHNEFRRFQEELDCGNHIFIVDVDSSQENVVKQLQIDHPSLHDAGAGSATPRWIVMGQQSFKDITSTTFP
jgi:F0F1-type ATP synthase assembly protein I